MRLFKDMADDSVDLLNYQAIRVLEVLGNNKPTQLEINNAESFVRSVYVPKTADIASNFVSYGSKSTH